MRLAGQVLIDGDACGRGHAWQDAVSQLRIGRENREVIALLPHRQLIQYANTGFRKRAHFAGQTEHFGHQINGERPLGRPVFKTAAIQHRRTANVRERGRASVGIARTLEGVIAIGNPRRHPQGFVNRDRNRNAQSELVAGRFALHIAAVHAAIGVPIRRLYTGEWEVCCNPDIGLTVVRAELLVTCAISAHHATSTESAGDIIRRLFDHIIAAKLDPVAQHRKRHVPRQTGVTFWRSAVEHCRHGSGGRTTGESLGGIFHQTPAIVLVHPASSADPNLTQHGLLIGRAGNRRFKFSGRPLTKPHDRASRKGKRYSLIERAADRAELTGNAARREVEDLHRLPQRQFKRVAVEDTKRRALLHGQARGDDILVISARQTCACQSVNLHVRDRLVLKVEVSESQRTGRIAGPQIASA